MPPRNRRPPCHNCPKAVAPKTTPKLPTVQAAASTPAMDFPTSEALRLWNHVLFGTGTCVGMIEGYAALNMPGDPLAGIKHLRDRLSTVIHIYEDRARVTDNPHE